VLIRIALGLLFLAAACSSEGASNDCKNVCRKEAACVDQAADEGKEDEEQNRFDQSECIAACDALNRDPVGKTLVEKHRECAEKAGDDCAALLQCK
jgi:hypothetical protein